MRKIRNVLSFDIESWTHRDKIANGKRRKAIDDGFIVRSSRKILDLLKKIDVKTTFFILGEIYEWYPELINEINRAGHEIAYHSHSHKLMFNKTILKKELDKSYPFIKRFNPIGFRAPEIYLRESCQETLAFNGFKYDSSTYGPFELCQRVKKILEIPVSTYKIRGNPILQFPRHLTVNLCTREIPFGSGYFIGLLGTKTSYFINQLNKDHKPAVLFIHNWQLFETPKKHIIAKMLPYYINRYKAIVSILKRHKFYTFGELVKDIEKTGMKNGSHSKILE